MSEEKRYDFETARAALRQLPETADRTRDELLRWIDVTESRVLAEQANVRLLLAENERLKRELGKLRLAQAGVMSSRLKDALRE